MLLLDTHSLIWFMFDDTNLSETALARIKNEDRVCVSIASLWEISIKQSLGKLNITNTIQEIASKCKEAKIEILPITPAHLDCLQKLPTIHKDPFDRLIIAQAKSENLSIVTKDTMIPKYGIPTLW